MTIEQIIANEQAEHAAYEAKTVVTQEGETIADLRKVFDAVCNPKDWKAPWVALVHHSQVFTVMKAVEFFHADKACTAKIEPLTRHVWMEGKGYQAY